MFLRDWLDREPHLHRRERGARENYFRTRNPAGYHHDLGAQDVFLDNLGILFREQFTDDSEAERYLQSVGNLLLAWERAWRIPVEALPWWGKHLNAAQRRAAAGEPRPLLRLLLGEMADMAKKAQPSDLQSESVPNPGRFTDWPSGALEDLFEPLSQAHPPMRWNHQAPRPYGIELPDALAGPVERLAVLDPKHATPDLPLRFESRAWRRERKRAARVLESRNQGHLGTCASFATCFALEIAALRAGRPYKRLSPAWLHLKTGPREPSSRRLGKLADVVFDKLLPCPEASAPYEDLLSGLLRAEEQLLPTEAARQELIEKWGAPEITQVDHRDIASLKTFLAAGWVLLVSTRITEGFQRRLGAMEYGLPLLPLPGESSVGGHAWCVVGYDHVDGGTHHWKYQGRFIALNSWGTECHTQAYFGPGTISLPFTFLAQEGIDAFALRF